MKTRSSIPVLAIGGAVAVAGMALLAVIDQAAAGKGITATNTGTYKTSPIVREHRGKSTVSKPPAVAGCSRFPHRPCARPIVRDHRKRGPRVVPKEDPPQKW